MKNLTPVGSTMVDSMYKQFAESVDQEKSSATTQLFTFPHKHAVQIPMMEMNEGGYTWREASNNCGRLFVKNPNFGHEQVIQEGEGFKVKGFVYSTPDSAAIKGRCQVVFKLQSGSTVGFTHTMNLQV